MYLVLVCALALLSFEFQAAWSIIFPTVICTAYSRGQILSL